MTQMMDTSLPDIFDLEGAELQFGQHVAALTKTALVLCGETMRETCVSSDRAALITLMTMLGFASNVARHLLQDEMAFAAAAQQAFLANWRAGIFNPEPVGRA